MNLTSPVFEEDGLIPAKYTCDGDRFLSPPLYIENPPEGTKSFVLIVDDPDVPVEVMPEKLFTHWVLFDIPADTEGIPEGTHPGHLGMNTRGEAQYSGPCPPPEYDPAEHRYFFKLFALDSMLNLEAGSSREHIEEALEGHVLERIELVARYRRT
ncbi:YbhB/YbcL family Raf kinase inhibitor-like protein [Patescibacteria group bacterium]|nr:YbhB/YbcL family Raf kinase inhibitor-like protein [Patescibacteria group bacterium]